MVNLTINNKAVTVPEGTTILEAARQAGIDIPHLCYLKKLNEIGACRVCCVEVEGERNLVPSCNNPVVEGMVIHTNSPRARRTRKINVELILSQHDCHCATCQRSGNCHLQTMANDLGILDNPYPRDLVTGVRALWPRDFPLYRDTNKCIKCMRCIQVCDKIQGVNVWDLSGTGSRTRVDVSRNRRIKESDCVLCGQCITHCPTGALRERSDTEKAFAAIEDPDRITVVQIAPAVGPARGERHRQPPAQAPGKPQAAAPGAEGVASNPFRGWAASPTPPPFRGGISARGGRPPGGRASACRRRRPPSTGWPRRCGRWASTMSSTPPSPPT